MSQEVRGYNLPINGIYWSYNPFANHLLTSWDIQVPSPEPVATNESFEKPYA